jgi:hypothetical protein
MSLTVYPEGDMRCNIGRGRLHAGEPEVGPVVALDVGLAGAHPDDNGAELHFDIVVQGFQGFLVEFEGVREFVLGDLQADVIDGHLDDWIVGVVKSKSVQLNLSRYDEDADEELMV